METALLKGFAVGARVDLLGEVGARLDVVLAPGSSERVERPGVVVALERVVDLEGRDAVIDRVAYTWFNRLVAFRFMDVNGFTRVGVVSPEAGKLTGQPQVLADAKGGDFEVDVVNVKTQAAVTALLNGTRLSVDAQGEAYGLLVEAYCRFWNKVMPFMFEREGDFTELLLPTDLLASNSVRSRAVQVLTEDVCEDVEVIGWLYQFYISERKDEVFAGFKKGKKAGAAEIPAATQLFTPDWIVRYLVENSLGRLWMLNHPDSHLVNQMDYYIAPIDEETDFLKISSPQEIKIIDPACGSGHMLTYAFDLLYAIYLEESHAPSEIPGLILKHNLFGTEIDARAGALAAFALTMKARAKQSTFFKRSTDPNICVLQPISFTPDELDQLVSPRGDRFAEEDFWNAFAQADTLGALIHIDEALIPSMRTQITTISDGETLFSNDLKHRAETVITQSEYLASRYHVVVANPPYMGNKNMDPKLSEWAKRNYPQSKNDLFAMFIERSFELLHPDGLLGMITMQSWMFLSSFREFRFNLLNGQSIKTMAHLGAGAFDSIGGAVVSTTAFALSHRPNPNSRGCYIRLLDFSDEKEKATQLRAVASHSAGNNLFEMSSTELLRVPGAPIAYWLSEAMQESFGFYPPVADVGRPRVGMQTANNDKFLRLWWEVSNGDIHTPENTTLKWLRYLKGGPSRRWYGNLEYVVWYNADPNFILAQPNATMMSLDRLGSDKITWTDVSAEFAARAGVDHCFHDIKGHCFYPDPQDFFWLLAYSNSSTFRKYLAALSPSLNFQVGDVGRVPLPPLPRTELSALAKEAVQLSADFWNCHEQSWDFQEMRLLIPENEGITLSERATQIERTDVESSRNLKAIEDRIDVVVGDIDSHAKDRKPVPAAVSAPTILDLSQTPQIEELVSYSIGCMFGRYSLDLPGLILADEGATLQDYLAKVSNPSFMPDADNVIPIVDSDWFEDDVVGKFRQFLRVSFGEEHFEENLKFVVDSLGVKNLREYFVKSFYKDHVQRYKKRPIYWLFSSPKGSFNALIYLHRYNPSTVSTVLNDYLREYIKKLEVSLERQERIVAGGSRAREVSVAQKESDRLRKVLIELADYERDLYALASQQIALDLDDGVLVNYQKFGKALKDIGLKKGAADD